MGSNSKKKSGNGSKHDDPKDGGFADCCQIFGRIALFVAGLLAVIFSLLVLASCDFIEFAAETSSGTVNQFSFGQFRYDPNEEGCQSIDDAGLKIDWTIRTSRVSTAVTLVCAGVACLIILVEFVCCRFKFSRCLMITLFSVAILGMAMAFIMFASDVCTTENSQGRRYPCKAGMGAWYALVAIGLYFVTSISSCFAPRPKPMIRRLTDKEENDPCICCRRKKKDEEKDEEQPEPVPVQEPPPPVPVQEPLPPPPVQEDTAAPVVVAAATVPAATQAAPVSQVITGDGHDDMSQVSSVVHPSNISAVTMPTFRDVSLYDGDMFFDSNSV